MVVALGSNLRGHYRSNRDLLEAALRRLPDVGLDVTRRSRWWRSAAWPDRAHPDYLNGVALVETSLPPREVLDALLRVEMAFGRRRGAANDPRTLDLDLIAYGRAILEEPGLALPHPRAHQRLFVVGPLADVAPDWIHPELGATAAELAAAAVIGADAVPLGEP
ncbi:2-amino-4-hydroxy-6-hydroxymethyldihydropteridine diphosphokinase [Phenylobacterium sp.]|uniref:2-amino-4-hydroxy-6- hydroxymethyldihydropteridine diphosphokinase n=1 Tax=Phenylobacterium sp. TaxID=1871053 RepID=UPI002C71A3AF|nr:2-amino-4-hydroxy-6-hydroxymethyldihydropteridine diphosphokinase [Phenylobacterium sp.]HLZ77105.1 2-amino-4-hydroxy-6-hydroxymethyldihydropteridine diphosphokinase [Phenylobacterium sp.]